VTELAQDGELQVTVTFALATTPPVARDRDGAADDGVEPLLLRAMMPERLAVPKAPRSHYAARPLRLHQNRKIEAIEMDLELRIYKGKSTIRRATRAAGRWIHPEEGTWTCVLLP
jgi:hypothetical protein